MSTSGHCSNNARIQPQKDSISIQRKTLLYRSYGGAITKTNLCAETVYSSAPISSTIIGI
mgnify:CR=1 FL=1